MVVRQSHEFDKRRMGCHRWCEMRRYRLCHVRSRGSGLRGLGRLHGLQNECVNGRRRAEQWMREVEMEPTVRSGFSNRRELDDAPTRREVQSSVSAMFRRMTMLESVGFLIGAFGFVWLMANLGQGSPSSALLWLPTILIGAVVAYVNKRHFVRYVRLPWRRSRR